MATFILVHGAFHGGWCFERLVAALARKGHRALAPDLPSMGEDTTPPEAVSLAGWGAFVADMAAAETERVILVGHSRGGQVIGEAAELKPEAVAGLVYLTALLFPGGTRLAQIFKETLAPRPGSGGDKPARAPSAAAPAASLPPTAFAATFYSACTAEDAAWATSRLCAEPSRPSLDPLSTTAERWGRIPRAYIECALDQTIPLASQRRMQEALPCDPVITLEADHSPFLGRPAETADALDTIARAFATRA
jgi:pimeloyl-ACP methyl ester carboxylesterase